MDVSRTGAIQNTIWYYSKQCLKDWNASVKEHIQIVNNLKHSFKKRVRSFAYLCVSDIIEQKINISLRKAF